QYVGGVLAARVQAQTLADLLGAARLVDVAVQADGRLVALDGVADGPAADGDEARPAAVEHRPQVRVELGRRVEPRPVGWIVEVADRRPAGLDPVHHRRDSLPQLLLGILALGVPWRRRDVADAREHGRAEVAQLAFGALHPFVSSEHLVDLDRV